jgi:hypothetical protein
MASTFLTPKRATAAAAILLTAGALLLWRMPNEATLGPVVKVVVLHGALVQAGLYAFLIAGILGAVWLLTRRESVLAWCGAVQKTAVIIWIAYALSSMVSTYMAWGQWIAWDEPRVRTSAYVLILALASLGIVVWVNDALFTALANIVTAAVAWYLVKGVGVIRHPVDPLGPSTDAIFRMMALALQVIVLCLAALLARALHRTAVKGRRQYGGSTARP